MTARSKAVEQAADELYELPPGEFTRARDERAKALRQEGHRDEADAVKALRKPTVAAWALNQLARRRPKEVEGLLAAGDDLRGAQEELLAGGDRKAFQSTAANERDQVAKLAAGAAELAAEAGERATPALKEKLAATLHAAALDEETAEELRAGRLVREREAVGGFGAMTAAVPERGRGRAAPASPEERKTRAGPTQPAKARKAGAAKQGGRRASAGEAKGRKASADAAKARKAGADEAKRRKASADEAKRRKASADEAARRQRLAAARTDERHARRELESAITAAEHAETRAEAAAAHAAEANRRAATTEERLKEARRAQTAARKAHARAERALKSAERTAPRS